MSEEFIFGDMAVCFAPSAGGKEIVLLRTHCDRCIDGPCDCNGGVRFEVVAEPLASALAELRARVAELEADRKRLEWLEARPGDTHLLELGPGVRAAIDAAKEER